MSNKKYIKVVHNDYGYEIYEINGDNKKKFKQQEKIIMHKLLRKYKCIKQNNTFIFTDYNLIMLNFMKEKLTSKPVKVNRKKSKKILVGVVIAAVIISGIHTLDNIEMDSESPTTVYEQTIPDYINNDQSNINDNYYVQNNINEFCYEFEKPNDKEDLIQAQNYMELFHKYEKLYGVDAQLLCAIGAQESSGFHHSYSTNGGYAVGLMQIEYIWDNEPLRVFNFEKNEYETLIVDYSKIGELEYNIKIGAAIFQNYFYHTLRNSDFVDETDYLAFTLQKYNMGPGNMRKVLSYDGNWVDNRDMIGAGDKYYFEHVLSRLENGTIINLRMEDGSYYSTKITNLSLVKHHNRV